MEFAAGDDPLAPHALGRIVSYEYGTPCRVYAEELCGVRPGREHDYVRDHAGRDIPVSPRRGGCCISSPRELSRASDRDSARVIESSHSRR